MEVGKLDYSYLTVKELKTVCKFFKVEVSPKAKREQVEALLVLAQTQMAMATVQAYEHYLVEVGKEDGVALMDISSTPLGPS